MLLYTWHNYLWEIIHLVVFLLTMWRLHLQLFFLKMSAGGSKHFSSHTYSQWVCVLRTYGLHFMSKLQVYWTKRICCERCSGELQTLLHYFRWRMTHNFRESLSLGVLVPEGYIQWGWIRCSKHPSLNVTSWCKEVSIIHEGGLGHKTIPRTVDWKDTLQLFTWLAFNTTHHFAHSV